MSREFRDEDKSSSEGEERKTASIGASITIKGEISGAEDLLIEGTVEGTVNVREHTVTVGGSAKVNADIFGNVIRVEGTVNGDLYGREQIVVHKSGCVRGNITAPRLSLEDGARLKGAIDTEPGSGDTVSVEKIKSTGMGQELASRPKELSKKNGVPTGSSML